MADGGSLARLKEPVVDQFSLIKTCKPTKVFHAVPSINLSNPNAKALMVEACKEFGFFKLINHGVPMNLVNKLEDESLKFFKLTQDEKERASCFGYGNKKIGQNGDMGWVEYLLLSSSCELFNHTTSSISKDVSELLQIALGDYISAIKSVACEILKLIAQGLNIVSRDAFANLIKDKRSDCFFRVNHYPPCSELQELSGENVVGFGEHTDPQIISVLRSNNIYGFEICLPDGSWVSVPPDPNSLFISVGDCLQVMTNGRFKSVRHRVSANSMSSRISFIYFGGPRLAEKIVPFPTLLEEGETMLYKEFTWSHYKKSAGESKLGDDRLRHFKK